MYIVSAKYNRYQGDHTQLLKRAREGFLYFIFYCGYVKITRKGQDVQTSFA